MKHSFLAIRAIAAELTHRLYKPVVITAAIVSVVFIILMIWLLTISAWWLLLAIPGFILILVVTAFLILAAIVIKTVAPKTSPEQQTEIRSFVDHIQEVSEFTQTPKGILLYKIVKDAVSPQKTAYIESIISGVGRLKGEYQSIVTSFSIR